MTRKTVLAIVCLASAAFLHEAQAEGNAQAGKGKSAGCAGCHGEDGNANAPIFPKLASQHANYLVKQLHDFKAQRRINPTMNAMAAALSDEDIADLSAYYSSQAIKSEKAENSPVNALGEKLFRTGNPASGVPACSSCHGPTGTGNGPAGFPMLKSQYAAYLGTTLTDFKTGKRNNDPNAIMRTIASKLSEEEVSAVADYVSALK
jgi:cytochrome c553